MKVMGCLLVFLALLPMYAQPPAIEEHEVVTAQFRPESAKDAAYPVQVLDQARIKASGARTLDELFAVILNLEQDRHRLFGSSLGIGGLTSEHIKILLDGVPVVGRLDGKIDLGHLRLENIEQVEIIEGPVSVYYGNDALGGVVNLITRDPPPGHFHGSLTTSGDENRGWGRGADLTTSIGSVRLGLDGFLEDFSGQARHASARTQVWPAREQDQFGLVASMPVGRLMSRLRARQFEERLTDAGAVVEGSAMDTRYRTQRRHLDFQVQGVGFAAWYLDLQWGYSDYDRDQDRLFYTVRREGEQWVATEAGRDPVAYRHQFVRGLATKQQQNLQWQIGTAVSADRTRGNRILDGEQTMDEMAVFGGLQWQAAPGLVLQSAVRWTDHSRFNVPLTPALNLRYQTPTGWTWRADYSRGFRGPSLKELYLDFAIHAGPILYHITGSQNLRPERSHSVHLSTVRDWSTDRFTYRVEGRAHWNRVDHLIALSQVQPLPGHPGRFERHYVNVNDHRDQGVRVYLGAYESAWQFRIGLGWSLTEQRLGVDSRARDLDRLDGSFEVRWQPPRSPWSVALFGKTHGRQPGFVTSEQGSDVDVLQTTIPRYTMANITLRWAHPRNGLELTAGVYNVANVESLDVLTQAGSVHETNLIAPGRTFRWAVAWSW